MAEGTVEAPVGGTPSPAPAAPAAGDPKPGTSGQPGANANPAPGAPPGHQSGDWDRERKGFQADLKREREARQKRDNEYNTLKGQLDEATKRIQALAGVAPQDQSAAQRDEIRKALIEAVPELQGILDPEAIKQIAALRQMIPALTRTTEHYWQRHGTGVLTQIEKAIEKETGGKLTEFQQRSLRSAYIVAAESDPEFRRRHEEDPEGLATEFVKQWTDGWFEPVKRRSVADEAARLRPVPGAKDRALPKGKDDKPLDINDDNAVGDFLLEDAKARGVQFGRRR